MDFFAAGTKTTVRKLPLFMTVFGSGSAATANVYEVSEPRVETWCHACTKGKRYVISILLASWKN